MSGVNNAATHIRRAPVAESKSWKISFSLFILFLAWGYAFSETILSLEQIYRFSLVDKFCYAVLPISLFIIYCNQSVFTRILPHTSRLGFFLTLSLVVSYIIGSVYNSTLLMYFSVIAMIPAIILLIFGMNCFRSIKFPLLFLLFLLPVGEFILPTVQLYSNKFLLHLLIFLKVPIFWESNVVKFADTQVNLQQALIGTHYVMMYMALGCLGAYAWIKENIYRFIFICSAIMLPIFGVVASVGIGIYLIYLNQVGITIEHLPVASWIGVAAGMLLNLLIANILFKTQFNKKESFINWQNDYRGYINLLKFSMPAAMIIAAAPFCLNYINQHLQLVNQHHAAVILNVPDNVSGWNLKLTSGHGIYNVESMEKESIYATYIQNKNLENKSLENKTLANKALENNSGAKKILYAQFLVNDNNKLIENFEQKILNFDWEVIGTKLYTIPSAKDNIKFQVQELILSKKGEHKLLWYWQQNSDLIYQNFILNKPIISYIAASLFKHYAVTSIAIEVQSNLEDARSVLHDFFDLAVSAK